MRHILYSSILRAKLFKFLFSTLTPFIWLIYSSIFFGCTNTKTTTTIAKDPSIYRQDALAYVTKDIAQGISDSNQEEVLRQKLMESYLKEYFSPWISMRPNNNINEVFWVKNSILKNPGFGMNRLPNTPKSMQAIWQAMNIKDYPSALDFAIVTESSAVRAIPSDMPRFSDPDDYPFDQWQNSLIFANTPILITHYDTSRQWAHIQSGFVYGWIKVQHLALIDEKDRSQFMETKQFVIPYHDNIPLYDDNGNFLTIARMGQIFGIQETLKEGYKVFVFKRDTQGKAQRITAKIQAADFAPFPRKFSHKISAEIINTMIGDQYGWGGYLGYRDCSAFVRDIFANFGLYLPRNSKSQAFFAKNLINLEQLSREEKENYILKNATPFGSILWLKGHIMLYIGEYKGKAMVAHSAWSVKTFRGSEKIKNMLGGVVITSLYAGSENNDSPSQHLLIDKILGISDLYAYMETL